MTPASKPETPGNRSMAKKSTVGFLNNKSSKSGFSQKNPGFGTAIEEDEHEDSPKFKYQMNSSNIGDS